MVGGPAWGLGGWREIIHTDAVAFIGKVVANPDGNLHTLVIDNTVYQNALTVRLIHADHADCDIVWIVAANDGHLSLSLRHHRRCKDTLRDFACVVKRKMRQDSMKSERAHEMAGIKQIVLDRIREILHEKPGITPGQLAEETGLAPNTITKYLRAIREEWQGRG